MIVRVIDECGLSRGTGLESLGANSLSQCFEWPVADLGSPSTDLEFGRINVIFLSLGTVFGLRVYTLKVSNVRNCSCIDWSSVWGIGVCLEKHRLLSKF